MGKPQTKFENPWRDLPKDPKNILNFVKTYKPLNNETSSLRVLLHGPVGAGKSSFVNSVESVVSGRISGRIQTDAASSTSFTKTILYRGLGARARSENATIHVEERYNTYKINKGGQSYCSFVFTDTMGLEAGGDGISKEDMELALRGHVKEGYKFKPKCPLTEGDNDYNACPSLADKVHVLVVVIPVTSIDVMSDDVWRKLREIRLAASDMNIPQMAILTKVDEACPVAKEDVKDVYRSIYLKEQVDKFHQLLGISMNCIFLVKNYVSEINTNDVMDAQILLALRQMIHYGEDFLNN